MNEPQFIRDAMDEMEARIELERIRRDRFGEYSVTETANEIHGYEGILSPVQMNDLGQTHGGHPESQPKQ